MVASTHWLASAAGMAVLERGGNAFDAAVAAGLALQVVEPHLNGPGGDLPAIVYSAERDDVRVLCGQGPAPRAATIDRFRELGVDLIPGTGFLPAVVPGAFDGWMLMLRDLGTMRFADVAEYAIGFAGEGFPVVPAIGERIERVEEMFRTEWTTSADVFLPAPTGGMLFRNPDVAATYRRLVDESRGGSREAEIDRARSLWYRGFVAEAIDAFVREEVMDSSGRRHAGFLSGDDLASYEARWEEPVTLDYRGHTVFKTGPWGQGPVFLQQLALLEGFDLGELAVASADLVHTVVECAKLAFADREAWYGDPDFVDVPLDLLLSRDYAEERAARWSRTPPRPSCVRAGPTRCCRPPSPASWAPAWASRRGRAGTPSTLTSSIATGTSSRRRRAAGGSGARRSFPVSASRSERVRRCSGWRRGSRTRWNRGNGREPRCPRHSRFAAAIRISPSERRAATSRTSGRSSSSSTTSTSGSTCRRRSMHRASTRTTSRARSIRAPRTRGGSRSRVGSRPRSSTSSASAGTTSRSRGIGRWVASAPPAARTGC
jgi:hypothetical protein